MIYRLFHLTHFLYLVGSAAFINIIINRWQNELFHKSTFRKILSLTPQFITADASHLRRIFVSEPITLTTVLIQTASRFFPSHESTFFHSNYPTAALSQNFQIRSILFFFLIKAGGKTIIACVFLFVEKKRRKK